MAEVLQVPRQPDGHSYYQSSPLRRSQPSSSTLFLGPSPSHSPQLGGYAPSPPTSSLSSSPMPPAYDLSPPVTFQPSPLGSSLSLEEKYSTDDDFTFPNYNSLQFFGGGAMDVDVPPPSPARDQEVPDEDTVEDTTTDTTRSDSPLPTPTVADDTAIKQEPSRHVDYLSHDWREEDIWSSWRHIVSQRKTYGERSRLENASWRTWAKSKYRLRTISPETLNWLKESDVTWLYGPLQPAPSHPITSGISEPTSNMSKNNSFIHKKPILKKRSMSEVMLQRSLSNSSLLQQAAASVEAQQTSRPYRINSNDRSVSDFMPSSLPSEYPSRDEAFSSRTSSSFSSTPCERRHIRFDEKVEQCIAVECKEGDMDDERRNCSSRSSSISGRKMISTLPASTLKSKSQEPDPSQQQQYTFGSGWTNRLSPSPSQETLKPTNPNTNFLIGDDDREPPSSNSWSFGSSNSKSSLGSASSSYDNLPSSVSSPPQTSSSGIKLNFHDDEEDDMNPDNLRRTNSGMFMPISAEDAEDEIMAAGLFGRVSETINTAKDIAHVIWNVGWNK
ncbi:hypothetical protein K431DRAFT_32567 [Polychaeton citri CBS 116435]|uniref:Nitrogen regulatory protein areA GATA-like domain-containing protein n=1 Tax=Polychaeton citri CBS 116435 TaxID=1314669 RepID=A0A9P4UQQ4_9PEZI|nr:hypothetical protein K431DRAFT_32567 [Polychaeton citri CBS 116435]